VGGFFHLGNTIAKQQKVYPAQKTRLRFCWLNGSFCQTPHCTSDFTINLAFQPLLCPLYGGQQTFEFRLDDVSIRTGPEAPLPFTLQRRAGVEDYRSLRFHLAEL
jgi:hypothetical protein